MDALMDPARICLPAYRSDPVPSVNCGPNGGPCLDGRKSYEKWYQGGFIGVNNAFPSVIGANETQILTLRASAQDNNAGDLLLSQLVGNNWTSNKLAVRLYSQWLDRYFSNVGIPVELLFGTPNFPGLLMGDFYVKAGTSLQAQATDLSGSQNTASLTARGFRNLIQQGGEGSAANFERAYWEKARKFLPYFLGPDIGPQVPAAGTSAITSGSSVQITLTCPSVGDFYMTGCYLFVNGGNVDDVDIVSWNESGASSSFIDPVILPLRASLVFSGGFGVTNFDVDNRIRASMFPGGWGGDQWIDGGQWVHRLHRGTQMQMTLKAARANNLRFSPVMVGYLATCDGSPGEFLAFPMNQGQVSRPFQQVPPGGSCAPCPPGMQAPPGGRIIVAPQSVPGMQPGGVNGACPPARFFAPGKQQLHTGGQGW